MAEYIEKEAALAIIARKQKYTLNDVVDDACGQFYQMINSLPTQEVKPEVDIEAERLCREMNIFRIDLKSVMIDFIMDFYHKLGYEDTEEDDGFMGMFKMLK